MTECAPILSTLRHIGEGGYPVTLHKVKVWLVYRFQENNDFWLYHHKDNPRKNFPIDMTAI
jgi:hypothetical protein